MVRKSPNILKLVDALAAEGRMGEALLLRRLPKGHTLIVQGEAGEKVYVIRSGIVKCFIGEDNEKEYILEFLGEGEVLGELEAICGARRLCTVRTLTETSVYLFDKTGFLDLLAKDPVFNKAIMELLAIRLANTASRASRQQLYTLEHNLDQLIAALDAERLPCSKQDLADYLGISLRSLNRLLKEKEGVKK